MGAPTRERWSKDYPRWFDQVITEAEIYDYGRYPVKGMGVWMPYGFQIRRRVIELMRELLDATGHEEVLFPLLIPEDLLKKESEHVKGFEDEVYWVTHGGLEELDVKLALRPTSETSITFMESLWIKSYKQTPRKFYQIVSVFRYETKATRPMIRLREVTTFKEAHTVHDTFESSEKQVLEAISIYRKFFDELGIPYVISKRPEWDKFPGALYTIAFDTIMPDGRVLQIGTVHNLGQNFSKAFDFRIQLADQTLDYPWQTSYGISDRVIATLISIHGDDRGLVLPTKIAPIQVVIVPIPGKTREETIEVNEYVDRIADILRSLKVRFHLDDREDVRPGAKFYYWELKGVPIRLEVGPKEARSGTVVVTRRDTLEKHTVELDKLREELSNTFKLIDETLRSRAREYLESRILRTQDLDEAKEWIAKRRGIVEVPWCGDEEHARRLEEKLDAKALGTPYPIESARDFKCPICGRRAVTWMRFAKTY